MTSRVNLCYDLDGPEHLRYGPYRLLAKDTHSDSEKVVAQTLVKTKNKIENKNDSFLKMSL